MLLNNRFIDSVKVGAKGQIVIPKEVRDMFGIKPGDSLILLADRERGIALNNNDYFNKIADKIFASDGVNPADSMFAGAIKNVLEDEENDPE